TREQPRELNRDLVPAPRLGRGVAHPLPRPDEDRLAGADVEGARLVLDAQRTVDDDGVLVEVGALAGLDPALGRLHARDAQALVARVDAADELVDQLRLGPGGLDAARALDDLGHVR